MQKTNDKTKNNCCPICYKRKPQIGHNDLVTTHPSIASEWHPTENGDFTAQMVTHGSGRTVLWRCEKGHIWPATIKDRTGKERGCPICTNQKVLIGYNDLATTHPSLAAEWHPTENGDLTPQMVTYGTKKSVKWICKKGHSWNAQVMHRSNGTDCSICANKTILAGYNDLVTTHPSLAAEWHPTRNGNLTPQEVSYGTRKKAWWLCACGHSWEAAISSRTSISQTCGCPKCSGKIVIVGENDLATTHPAIAVEWHPTKNGELTPQDVSSRSGKEVYWLCAFGHSWKAKIYTRTLKEAYNKCPTCLGKKVLKGYNDLATTHPAIADEWHPTKNGELTPQDVLFRSSKVVWWLSSEGHSWECSVRLRVKGKKCPRHIKAQNSQLDG